MAEKIYLHLLILCGIWSQGFIGSFADEEIKESSDFLVRQKRVVSYVPDEDRIVTINNAPYIVVVKRFMRTECAGSILSHHVVVTAATCVLRESDQYQILSTTSRSDRGHNHSVIGIRRHLAIGLLTVDPPFMYGRYCKNIELHVGPLLPNTLATVSGWGYDWKKQNRGTEYPKGLRSIKVPIMAHRDCVNMYRSHFDITEKEVCTYDPQRHCGHTDDGAPLVVDDYLAGVRLWTGPDRGLNNPLCPDVFAVLQHSEYNHWIRSNVQNIDAQFNNGQHP